MTLRGLLHENSTSIHKCINFDLECSLYNLLNNEKNLKLQSFNYINIFKFKFK